MSDLLETDWNAYAARACGKDITRYPDHAGHRGGDTDKEAAERIEGSGRADKLRERVKRQMWLHPLGMTADECAEILREDVLSIRPRFTELKKQGILVDTGIRRQSDRGRSQRVLKHRDFV